MSTYLSRLFAIITLICFQQLESFAQSNFESKPIWNEEFQNQHIPDSNYWSYTIGMQGKELEFYTNNAKNVFCKSGNLILRALNEKKETKIDIEKLSSDDTYSLIKKSIGFIIYLSYLKLLKHTLLLNKKALSLPIKFIFLKTLALL